MLRHVLCGTLLLALIAQGGCLLFMRGEPQHFAQVVLLRNNSGGTVKVYVKQPKRYASLTAVALHPGESVRLEFVVMLSGERPGVEAATGFGPSNEATAAIPAPRWSSLSEAERDPDVFVFARGLDGQLRAEPAAAVPEPAAPPAR